MVRSISVQIAMLAFIAALLAGLYVGNSATVVLTRAVAALVAGALVGRIVGWAAKVIVRDHLQQRKLEIDRAHFAAVRAQNTAEESLPAE